jgi:peptidoglycan/LPS O-acetylase OafA/YrhL
MFALLVVVGHAARLGGYSWRRLIHSPLQDIAVNGFFAISGYLITVSALRSSTVRYLWQRVLRIFPGYWVCLLVIAFGLGIVGWLHNHSTLYGYFGGSNGAVQYVIGNADLRIARYFINGSPNPVPYQGGRNGSIWTLKYEFYCYLVAGTLALVRPLRRRLLSSSPFSSSPGRSKPSTCRCRRILRTATCCGLCRSFLLAPWSISTRTSCPTPRSCSPPFWCSSWWGAQ